MPLVLAITSLIAAFGILGIFSQLVEPVSPNAVQLIVLIGLAVAIDYSLFMITRFRTERRAGKPIPLAIEIASSTAGRAVFFSGLAVMISLAGLFTLGVPLFSSMAIGTIGVVLVSVIGSLTFLPATLAILGDKVNLFRPLTWIPRLFRALPLGGLSRRANAFLAWLDRRAARPEGSGFWGGLVTAVMRRPVVLTILSAALLLAVAYPVLHLQTGVTDITGFPSSIDGVAGIRLQNEKWPRGTDLTLDLVVTDAEGAGHDRGHRQAQDRRAQGRRPLRAGRTSTRRRTATSPSSRSRWVAGRTTGSTGTSSGPRAPRSCRASSAASRTCTRT